MNAVAIVGGGDNELSTLMKLPVSEAEAKSEDETVTGEDVMKFLDIMAKTLDNHQRALVNHATALQSAFDRITMLERQIDAVQRGHVYGGTLNGTGNGEQSD